MKNFLLERIKYLGREIAKFENIIKFVIFLVILSFFISSSLIKINLPAALDLPRQIANGKDILHGNYDVLTKNVYSYVEPNQPFANHHWLFGVIMYILLVVSGWTGLAIFKILLMFVTFLLIFWLSWKRSNFWLASLFSIPVIFILISRPALRPELFSYLFIVIFLHILLKTDDDQKSNRIFWLIPLQLIWVNVHIFFPIGILLVAGFLFEKIVLNFRSLKSLRLLKTLPLVLAGLVLVTFVNPFGLGGVIFSLLVNTSVEFPIHSMEVSSILDALKFNPSIQNISLYLFFPLVGLLVISFVTSLGIRIKKAIPLGTDHFLFLLIISIGSAGVSYFIFRAMPIFGIIFLLVMSVVNLQLWDVIVEWGTAQIREIQKIIKYSAIILLLIFVTTSSIYGQLKINKYLDQGLGLSTDSLEPAQFFKDNKLKGPILNDTDSGSYLIGELYPQEMVFSDNRFGDAYSAQFFSDIYLPIVTNEAKWKEALLKYNFNVIFMYQYDAGDGVKDFIFNRIYDPEWVWVYVDKNIVILVRNTIENKEVIDKFQIKYETIYKRLEYLINSKNPRDILNAADILNLVGRTDLSMPLYLKYVSLRPGDGEIWFVLGKTELRKVDQKSSNPGLAAVYLERAISEGWTTWQSYSFLALAYYRTGQLDKVKEAVNEEIKIVPDSSDVQYWVKVIADEEKRLQEQK